jgi:hypothetical protein
MEKLDLILIKLEKIEKIVESLSLSPKPCPAKKEKEVKYEQTFENYTGKEYQPKNSSEIVLPKGYKLAGKVLLIGFLLFSGFSAFAEECKDQDFCSIIEKSNPPQFYLGIESFTSGGYNTTTLKDYESCDCTDWRIVGIAFACDKWECFSTHDVIVPATTTWAYATITNPYLNTSSTSPDYPTSSNSVWATTTPFNSSYVTTSASTSAGLIEKSWTYGTLFISFLAVFFIFYTILKDILRFFFPETFKILRNDKAL